MDIYKLIDYYIEKYLEAKERGADGFACAWMLQGLMWICRFGGITDDDLGDKRLARICSR